jgi:RNA polymerase sigma factor (sigma-70 family)
MENLSDIELVENIKKDICTNESLQELINRHSGIYLDIVNSYMKCCPAQDLKHDIINEKEITIYNSALKYDENRGAKFSTYLGNEAKWKCLNASNKNKRNNKFVEMTEKLYDEEKQKSDTSIENYLIQEEILESFGDHLDEIPDTRVKKIFQLRYSGDKKLTPWRKVSKKMNLSIQGCINIHNSALKKISKNLKNKYEINL